MKVYQALAERLYYLSTTKNAKYKKHHNTKLDQICKAHLPKGDGFETGTELIVNECDGGNQLVLQTKFCYLHRARTHSHWICFKAVIKPCMIHGFYILLKGSFGDRQDLREYVTGILDEHLLTEYKE